MSDASKKRVLWLGTIGLAAVVIAVVIALAIKHGGGTSKLDQPVSSDQVKVEVRAKPVAQIRMDGKLVGRSPLTIVVKRTTKPMEIEAEFRVEKFRVHDRGKVTQTLKETRVVVPDDNQSVDFDVADAKVTATVAPDRATE